MGKHIIGYVKAFTKYPDGFHYKSVGVFYKVEFEDGLIKIYQPIKDKWHSVGQWLLSTLEENRSDTLYIDFGQGWFVMGMDDPISLATQIRNDILPNA